MTNLARIVVTMASCVLLAGGGCGKDEGKKDEGKKTGAGEATAGKKEGGGGGGNKLSGGCDRREKEKLCEEYYGDMAKPDWIKEQCTGREVPFVEACPTDGAIARCSTGAGTPQEMALLFYDGYTMETAKALCAGTLTAITK